MKNDFLRFTIEILLSLSFWIILKNEFFLWILRFTIEILLWLNFWIILKTDYLRFTIEILLQKFLFTTFPFQFALRNQNWSKKGVKIKDFKWRKTKFFINFSLTIKIFIQKFQNFFFIQKLKIFFLFKSLKFFLYFWAKKRKKKMSEI